MSEAHHIEPEFVILPRKSAERILADRLHRATIKDPESRDGIRRRREGHAE